MKKILLFIAFIASAVSAMADGVVAFGNNTDERAFTAKTVLASVNGWESEVLPDGNKVAITQTPAGVGKFWGAQAVKGTWANDAALAEFNKFSGLEFTASDLSDGTSLLVAANSNGQVNANLELLMDAQAEGDIVTLYVTLSGWNCPLDEITVEGLDECKVMYAVADGNGFGAEPTFTQVNQGLNMIKVTGTLTADKRVVVTSPTSCDVGKTKVGFQMAAYKITKPAVSYTFAFGNNTDERAFTAKTVLASVNGWESEVLPDGNKVAITQTPAGVGKFWGAQAVKGTWANAAALAEFNKFSGIEFTAADLSDGTALLVAANSNGQVNANLELLMNAQAEGEFITLYVTLSGWNCPLDEITVEGLDECKVMYAVADGNGFVAEPMFTQVNQGLNMIKVTGRLTADKRVIVTSPSFCDVGKTKVGFQMASYKVEEPTEAAVASYAETPEKAPCVAVQFNNYKTCFFDKYRFNKVDVTLEDEDGNAYEIVATSDNYSLADYSCDVTAFILDSELAAGNYTLTIPAGAMVVNDDAHSYEFNKEEFVLSFEVVGGVAPAKLVDRGVVDTIGTTTVEAPSVKKAIRNGKLVIIKGQNEYNVAGSLLK